MRQIFFLVLMALPGCISGQSSYAPLNEDYYSLIDRYEVRSGRIIPAIFTAIRPYKRSDIVNFIDSVKQLGLIVSAADAFNYSYLQNDSWEWSRTTQNQSVRPVLGHFYRKKSDFFAVDSDALDLHINPVIYAGIGRDSRRDDMLFVNTRGIEARGMVDRKIGFYTYLTDNQALLPSYVNDQMALNAVIPHEGFWKAFKEGDGVDFLQARGYIAFEATKHISLQFGHDRFFIGNGYRSLAFSDFGPPALFLKGNVRVWKLNYLFIVSQMVADNEVVAGTGSYPHKYNAFHHLSLNIGKKFNLGLFESVIFSPDDPAGAGKFRFDYLNPIIFYRAVEQQNGSSDNVLLGLDFKWNAVRKLSFYGQFLLDEFVLDHIRDGDGWWANKFGVQAGGRYVDAFGLSNLDLQGEFNLVRPYTYSHSTPFGNYSNYRQPIGHPLGANFSEIVGIARYQPVGKLNITGRLAMVSIGRDTMGANWGSNILKLSTTRQQEFNNVVGQGAANEILSASLDVSWQFKHNLFVDAGLLIRESRSLSPRYNNNTIISSLALRWNVARRQYDF